MVLQTEIKTEQMEGVNILKVESISSPLRCVDWRISSLFRAHDSVREVAREIRVCTAALYRATRARLKVQG